MARRRVGIGIVNLHHFVLASKEEESRPRKDPEECQVEHPADPGGGSPLIDLAWGIDDQAAVRCREADVEVASVIRFVDGRPEELLQFLCIVVRDLTFERE